MLCPSYHRGVVACLAAVLGLAVLRTPGPLSCAALQAAGGSLQTGAGQTPPPAQVTAGVPLAVFGIDAADWSVIDEMIALGQLPTFARLKRVAATGIMKAEPPLVSPIIWTTIATGKRAEDHGVLDFVVDVPGGGMGPVNGATRRVQAMWEIWSKAGRSVLVTGWWATWPADRVRGVIISDRVAPHVKTSQTPDGLVFPPERAKDLEAWRVRTEEVDLATLSRFVPVTPQEFVAAVESERTTSGPYRDRIAHLRAALAATRTYERASTSLISEVRPDLWAVYYELVDTVSHLFTRDRRAVNAIRAAYVEMDRALADAARVLAPNTLLVVLSDHGFHRPDAGIRDDPSDLASGAVAWHRPAGIVAVTTAGTLAATTPPHPGATALGIVSPLDILPTLLACAGLPTARDMPGRILPFCQQPAGVVPVASYGAHDQPPVAGERRTAAAPETERLRSLGYVSGGGGAPSSLARSHLAEILYRRGDYRGALRELEALVRADPINARAALWLARTLVALGRSADAVQQYDRLIQIAKTTGRQIDSIVFLAATDLDVREQRIDAAAQRLALVPPALALTPEVLTARGTVAEARQEPDVAEREYRHALDVAPADTESLGRLVDLLIRGSRLSVASSITAPLARRFGSSAKHQALAGRCALAERRYKDAEGYYQRALDLDAPTVALLNGLGLAHLQAGKKKEAAAAFEQSLQVDANQPEIRKLLASAR